MKKAIREPWVLRRLQDLLAPPVPADQVRSDYYQPGLDPTYRGSFGAVGQPSYTESELVRQMRAKPFDPRQRK